MALFHLSGRKQKETDNFLEDSYKNYRRNNTVVLQSFPTSVIQLVQCNCFSRLGEIFSNIYLNVSGFV